MYHPRLYLAIRKCLLLLGSMGRLVWIVPPKWITSNSFQTINMLGGNSSLWYTNVIEMVTTSTAVVSGNSSLWYTLSSIK